MLAGGGSLPHLRVLAATLGQPREPHSRQASSAGQLADAESRLHLPAHQARLRALLSSQPLRDTKLAERLFGDTRLLSWLPDEQQRPHVAVEPRHARREHQGVRRTKVETRAAARLQGIAEFERCRDRAPGTWANRDGSAWYQSAVS